MNPTDDQIMAMLETRADRASSDGLVPSAMRQVSAMPRLVAVRAAPMWRRPGSWVAFAAVVLVALVGFPALLRPTASATPSATAPASVPTSTLAPRSPDPSTSAVPSSSPIATSRALTQQDLVAMLQAHGATDLTLVLEGTLELESGTACVGTCRVIVRGTGDATSIVPTGDIGPGPWDGSGPITGTFALKMMGRDNGRTVLDFLGRVTPASEGLAWSVDALLDGQAAKDPERLVAVHGWLVGTPFHPCPSYPATTPPRPKDRFFHCGEEDYLTSTSFQPVSPAGVTGPARGIFLPSESYRDWAPDPSTVATNGLEPREGVYLLQWEPFGCNDVLGGPIADCFVDPADGAWFVRGRLEP